MIVNSLKGLKELVSLNPHFAKVCDYLSGIDLAMLEDGRYEIDGDKAYVTVKDHQLKKKEDARVEAHDKYIDIQIVIRGTESFGWVSRSDCKTVQTPMNEEKDIIFYADAPTTYVTLSSGQMVIFFPGDGHAPLVGDGTVRKAIVKVAVE